MLENIGVIGIGKMGLPIVRHLLAHRYRVFAYDIEPDRTEEACRLGALACRNPKDLASRSDLVIVLAGFDSEVLEIVQSPQGALAGAREGMILAIASTVRPDTMRRIEAATQGLQHRVTVLDIPLCRGEEAADAGKLLMLAGGRSDAIESCRPVFATFADDIFVLGELGAGQVGKMINNLLLWACVSANHEGLKLAAALGVETEMLRAALLKSSGSNWALETWNRPRPMPWAENDMSIVLQEADVCRLSLPLCGVVKEVIKGIKLEKGLSAPASRGGVKR